MAIHVQCTGCGGRFQAPEKLAGKRVKCPKCSAAVLLNKQTRLPSGEAICADRQTAVIPVACHDWPLARIAEHLGRTPAAVAGLLKRGLQQLRNQLQDKQ